MKKLSFNKGLKIMLVLSIMGALLSSYLWYVHIYNASPICPTGGCNEVLTSEYAYFLGVPVALWGLLYYITIFLNVMFLKKLKTSLFNLSLTSLLWIGMMYTLYLRYLEFFKLGSICVWCWGSVVIVVGLILVKWKMEKIELKQ